MLMHSKHRAFFRTAISALLALPLLAPSVEADGKLAVKAGRIITQAGDEIENGVIVIQGGRIAAIGAEGEVQIPWDAPVIDGSELVAFPGFVEAHSSRGMDRPNENVEVAPYLSIEDSIDPVNFYFQDSLRWGVTTINVQHGHNCAIGARGMVVKPIRASITPRARRSAPSEGATLSLVLEHRPLAPISLPVRAQANGARTGTTAKRCA